MVIKTGLSSFQSYISQGYTSNYLPSSTNNTQIGKVFGVVLNENIPSKAAFEKVGGYAGLGAIFYMDYNTSKTLTPNDVNILTDCSVALPFNPNIKNYPKVEEVVILVDGPSPASQYFSTIGGKYYLGAVNTWNNPQQNAPISTPGANENFFESSDIRPLLPFEGDLIIQSRKGSGIRFGTTNKNRLSENEWSTIGKNGDPITILVNGYVTTDTGSLAPNVEEINKEMSSIYMTSTQVLPLIPGSDVINPINSSLAPNKYTNSQIILNSDRVTINSKKDEILLFAKTNIEFSTNNIMNLNAGQYVHINSNKVLLGTKSNNTIPDEPVLLGNQTVLLLEQMITALNALGSYLSSAVVPTSDGVISIPAINNAGIQLLNDMAVSCDKLLKITSEKVYTT
jgi:hypothetical protein